MAWHSGKPADTDFLSASVQHIRENFAELEPLQPHVAELVDLTALQPHVAELVDLTALQPHVAALLGSRIVEMGTNSNGEYVRWENGLQVCWRSFYQSRPTETVTGSLYRDNDATTWTFPAAFTSNPNVYGSVWRAQDDNYRLFFSPSNVGTIAVTYRDVATAHGAQLGREDQLLAIGRWK